MTPEYKKNDASALFFKRADKSVGLHQNALESVGPPASAFSGWGGRSIFIFCILEVLALDNPRTTAYNKDKERRYPCKRLAPHQFKSLQKVMTATGWKRWAVISFCAFSFCCHKNHPFSGRPSSV